MSRHAKKVLTRDDPKEELTGYKRGQPEIAVGFALAHEGPIHSPSRGRRSRRLHIYAACEKMLDFTMGPIIACFEVAANKTNIEGKMPMLLICSGDKPRHSRPVTKGAEFGRHLTYFGIDRNHLLEDDVVPPVGIFYPHAYLSGQAFGNDLGAHFHTADQFQVVMQGGGALSGHPVETTCVHYAGAYTPYGPIVPDQRGIEYLTLRNSYDTGAKHMPAERVLLRAHRGAHRQHETPAFGAMPVEQLKALQEVSTRALIAPEEDGLGIWVHDLPPGASVTGPDPSQGGGQYWVVVAGGMNYGDEDDRPFSTLAFLSPDEGVFTARAGQAGLQVLTMQFPVFMPNS